ncbi:MBL fold metallo-hydrolase [Flagellimonas flava]|uniref:L-ascorbate metabolism protein UlaG, beta-lactamase superfamily n=1 Tax=Flagellimonas flava TaxID=570519 RepID=A0A1M5INB1_9FLAO|nr:MBL fold metallo-hydrolase [Allomuricauda flava]SHG29802.1 L-ascorbate metabolism protein UlaG, beta-lactamase superfamily [Allomuricauda flava]
MLITIGIIIGLLIVAYFAFVNFYPSFGGDVSKERQSQYTDSSQFEEGKFKNDKDVPKDPTFSEILSMTRKFFFTKVEKGRPSEELPNHTVDSLSLVSYHGGTRLMWFGHSAFLLQMNGKNILIDPMLGEVPAPHPLLGAKRFNEELPIAIEKLPKIDAVLISHDHYDHLDYKSIKSLKNKVNQFYVPLGVGVHLEAWGVPQDKIQELDWWQDTSLEDLRFVCTPAQHFSGRKFSNGQSTLWASWVIQSETESIFFSGDSGYANHFKEIGEAYGPFDFAMLECGQYNKLWPDIHMFPEETAQAGIDLKANVIMPIHWGAFKLALHSWTDPIERVAIKANSLGLPMIAPKIGAMIELNSLLANHQEDWWD